VTFRAIKGVRRLVNAPGAACVVAGLVLIVMFMTPNARAAGDENATQCTSGTEASPGFRTYLPDCRAYELVTPPYKEGGVVALGGPAAISPDGTRVIAGAGGAFAGAGNYWWQENRTPNFVAYEFTRTEGGWTPAVLTPPATQFPHSTLMAASGESLGTTLWGAATSTLTFNEAIYLRNDEGAFALVGPGTGPEIRGESLEDAGNELNLVGASRDLTHAIFTVRAFGMDAREAHSGRGNLWPGDTTSPESASLYEYSYHGDAADEPLLVGVTNEGALRENTEARLISKCGEELGSGPGGSMYNAVSGTGEAVFFTARECADGPAANEVYARVGAARTVAISEPVKADCEVCNTSTEVENATFQGASRNGEKVFFMTAQKLLAGREGMNLYEYDFNAPAASIGHPQGKIALVSGGVADPKVQGVVRVSEDGERVYFVAKAKLAPANAEGAEPEEEADNLYVYEPDPTHPGDYHTVFVAKLLTPAEEATLRTEEREESTKVGEIAEKEALRAFEEAEEHGEGFAEALELFTQVDERQETALRGTFGTAGTLAEDQRVWSSADGRPAQATPDGNFLVFPSSADLTTGDESKVPQLFEYDASSESLTRASRGEGGTYDNDGNVDTFNDAAHITAAEYANTDLPTAAQTGVAVSEDGSRVIFTSAAKLTPQAEGSPNVYEYREGNVYLISDGKDRSATENAPTVKLFGSDASGQDIFFVTADALVPQAAEAQVGLYDAREAGGFPAPAAEPGCSGETCRGTTALAPQLESPGTVAQAGGENLAPAVESKPAGTAKRTPLTRAQKLAKALKMCRAKRNRKKRASCTAAARRLFGAGAKTEPAGRKAGR
jgi:hypothetical protein